MYYKKHELFTLREHLSSSTVCLVGSVFLIFLVFGIVFFDLFVFVLCPLPNIASVSVLSIPHYPFSLWVKVRAMVFKPLSTIFQLYRGGQFCWRKYPEKTTACRKLLTNLSHNVVSSTSRHERGSNSQL